VTGRELHIVEHPLEAALWRLPCAWLWAWGCTTSMDDADDLIQIKKVVQPIAATSPRYEALYQVYRQLYSSLAPIYGSCTRSHEKASSTSARSPAGRRSPTSPASPACWPCWPARGVPLFRPRYLTFAYILMIAGWAWP